MSRKHFLSKQDIRNVKRSILDRQIKRHENDAMSVAILVHKLQNEPFNPVIFYKPQGSEKIFFLSCSTNRVSDGTVPKVFLQKFVY